jgi:hypothetical protein
MLATAFLPYLAGAQLTNVMSWVPLTKLEAFDTNTSVIILKASTDVG